MKHTFYYGNIYDGLQIHDAIELADIFGIEDGSEQDPMNVGDIIYPKKQEVKKYLGKQITLSLIDYSAGHQFLDVFICEQADGVGKYQEDSKLPARLWDQWKKYQDRTSKIISSSEALVEDNSAGHWLSEDKTLSAIESFFLTEVPKELDVIADVLKGSRDAEQRVAAAYLIQWQDQKEIAVHILLDSLANDSSSGVQNEATRALNPFQNSIFRNRITIKAR